MKPGSLNEERNTYDSALKKIFEDCFSVTEPSHDESFYWGAPEFQIISTTNELTMQQVMPVITNSAHTA